MPLKMLARHIYFYIKVSQQKAHFRHCPCNLRINIQHEIIWSCLQFQYMNLGRIGDTVPI